MSYMKAGRATKWTTYIFRWKELPENSGCSKFLDWEDFQDEFKKEFTPAQVDSMAINVMTSDNQDGLLTVIHSVLSEPIRVLVKVLVYLMV